MVLSPQAQVVAAVLRDSQGRFLLGKRSTWKASAPGYWCPISGAIEPGETESLALIRECLEESGLEVIPARKLCEMDTRDRKARIHWWLATLKPGSNGTLSPNDEHSELRWVSFTEFAALSPIFPEDIEVFREVSEGYRLRQAEPGDLPEISRLFTRCFRETYPNFPVLHTEAETFEFLSKTVAPKNSMRAAQDVESGRILGFVAFNSEFIDHLYVATDAHGRGIGGALLHQAFEQATRLQLWTFQQNLRARLFYARHGFAEIKLTDGRENEEKQPDVLLEWTRSGSVAQR